MGRIYRYLDKDGIIEYVGKVDGDDVTDVIKRLNEHYYTQAWSREIGIKTQVWSYVTKNKLETLLFETHFINLYETGNYHNKNWQVGTGCIDWLPELFENETWKDITFQPFKKERNETTIFETWQEYPPKKLRQYLKMSLKKKMTPYIRAYLWRELYHKYKSTIKDVLITPKDIEYGNLLKYFYTYGNSVYKDNFRICIDYRRANTLKIYKNDIREVGIGKWKRPGAENIVKYLNFAKENTPDIFNDSEFAQVYCDFLIAIQYLDMVNSFKGIKKTRKKLHE